MTSRRDINNSKNKKLLLNYAELTDKDMFYLEGKSDDYVNRVQSNSSRVVKEILNTPMHMLNGKR